MLDRCQEIFRERFGYAPDFWARAPGRVNLIGEHTDYNGGLVLPVAMQEAVFLVSSLRKDARVRIHAADLDETGGWTVGGGEPPAETRWLQYPFGAATLLQQEGITVQGLDCVACSNLPVGTGVSSSAAFTVAFINLFLRQADREADGVWIARLAQRVERVFAGVNCGIMDPLISQAGRAGSALFVDCATLQTRHVRIEDSDHVLLLFNTGVKRRLEESGYNRIRAECEEAASALGVEHLSQVRAEDLPRARQRLAQGLYERVLHVLEENERVRATCLALEDGRADRFGELLRLSHRSLKEYYRVSCDELDTMVDLAARFEGWKGGRMVGAGFGGCTVHLVAATGEDAFIEHLTKHYRSATGIEPDAYRVVPSDGASRGLLGAAG